MRGVRASKWIIVLFVKIHCFLLLISSLFCFSVSQLFLPDFQSSTSAYSNIDKDMQALSAASLLNNDEQYSYIPYWGMLFVYGFPSISADIQYTGHISETFSHCCSLHGAERLEPSPYRLYPWCCKT